MQVSLLNASDEHCFMIKHNHGPQAYIYWMLFLYNFYNMKFYITVITAENDNKKWSLRTKNK